MVDPRDSTTLSREDTDESFGLRSRGWLRPGPPRTLAAVLLLLGAVASIGAWGVLAELLGADRAGARQLLLFMAQSVAAAVPVVAVAGFVLTGSPASRVLGALTAVAALLLLVLPVVSLFSSVLSNEPSIDLRAAPFAAVAVCFIGAAVALAVPTSSRSRP